MMSFSKGNQSYLKITTRNHHGEELTEALQIFPGKCLPTEKISCCMLSSHCPVSVWTASWISQERYATLWADPPFTAKSDKV